MISFLICSDEAAAQKWLETDPASSGHFVDQLQRMHTDLDGEATLSDFFGVFELKFAVTDRRFGTISVLGRFFKETRPAAERGKGGGAFVRFQNLMTDQSYLPAFILALRTPNEP